MTEEYKLIEIQYKNEIIPEDLEIINGIFLNFPPEDITHEIENNTIKVYLNSLDLSQFKNIIDKSSHHIEKKSQKLLNELCLKIESIKSYGLKGNKRLYVGYNKEKKVKNRAAKEINRSQYYYAQDHNFLKDNNELPDKFMNKIICGDSLNVLKKLPDNCIDLVFTSPPYNFGLDYESTNDAHHWGKYFEKLFEIFSECIRVLKYGGRIAVNVQPLFSDYIPSHHIISNFFIEKKMIWKGEILWEKNNYNCKYTAWGSWKSPSNPYLKYTWEFIEVFSKGSLKKEGNSQQADISADEFKKWVVAKWSIAPERKMKEFNHPAMFPEELVARVLKLFSFENDIILDPFNGVGTTPCVAKYLNRKFLGIDISQEYCNKALDRINSSLF